MIFNSLGQIVIETQLTLNQPISIQHLPNGHYKVVVIDGENRSVGQLLKVSDH